MKNEHVVGLIVLATVLGITGNLFYALIAQCIAWIVTSIILKKDAVVITIYVSSLAVIIAIAQAAGSIGTQILSKH